MKILILSPFFDAQHNISMRLRASGAALLFPSDVDEAWKMIDLHGQSLDLAIISREGASDQEDNEAGFALLEKIKGDPAQADLPIIISSAVWDDLEAGQHQQGPLGANAYLRWPFTDIQLIQTIEAMFGSSIRFASATETRSEIMNIESGTIPLSIDGDFNGQIQQDQSRTGSTIALQASDAPASGTIDLQSFLAESGPVGAPPQVPQVPQVSPPPPPPEASRAVTEEGMGESASLDLSELVEELEPHERLALQNPNVKLETTRPTPQAQQGLPNESIESELVLETPGDTSVKSAEEGILLDPPPFEIPPPSFERQESGPQSLDGISLSLEADSQPSRGRPESQSGSSVSRVGQNPDEQANEELAQELPYLFGKRDPGERASEARSSMFFTEPVGDAVVPGGAAQAPDMDTLKKYLILREQDVAVLSNQLRLAREQSARLERQLKEERGRNLELGHEVGEHQRKLEDCNREKLTEFGALQAELEELRFQNKAKADKARIMEMHVKEATDEIERLKERVRSDIRKIRVREKELENRLEIMKKDSEALIAARENKIIELKRKVDLLEFNMDLLQDQYSREKEGSASLRDRLSKAVQVVRVAEGLLDPTEKSGERPADRDMAKARAKEAS